MWFRTYVVWREGRKTKQQIVHRWIWEQAYGPIPAGHHIHHKDGDPLNNKLSNLVCLSAEAHRELHARERAPHKQVRGVTYRKCQRCSKWRKLDQFFSRSAGTYSGYCKKCTLAYLGEWRDKHRDYWNAYHREHRRKTGDAYNKAYLEEHRDRINTRRRERYRLSKLSD